MRTGKRLLCVLLALVMVSAMLPVCAAVETYPESLYWDKAGEDADNGYKGYMIEFGAPLKVPEDPERYGYVFLGWKDWNTDEIVDLASETMNAKGRNFYAAWERETVPFYFYVCSELFTTTDGIPGEAFIQPRHPEQNGYTFSGWSPKTPAVTPETSMSFNAVFTPNTYIATLIVDGEVYDTIEYTYGQKSIDLPAVPKKEGYTGAWEPYSLGIGGVTIHAIYTPNTYIATLIVDGEVYDTIEYTYGQKSIVLPAVPKKEGYTGAWEPYSLGIGGVIIHAIYTPVTVPFYFYVSGELFTTVNGIPGEAFVQPRRPELDGYTFSGWSPKTPAVTPDTSMSFNAVFTPNTYVATLVVDGKVFKEIEYTYGQKSIVLPDVPNKVGYVGTWETYTLGIGGVTIHAIYKALDNTAKTIAGDADGDSVISLRDVAVMQRSLAGGYEQRDTCDANMDVNGDGEMNLKDVVLVRRYLAGWNVQLF